MVCGPLLETLYTSGPLRGFKIFLPNEKSIEDQKKRRSAPQIDGIFHQISIQNQKKRSSPQFKGIFLKFP